MTKFSLFRNVGPCAVLLASLISIQAHAATVSADQNSPVANTGSLRNLQVAGLEEWLESLQPRRPNAAVTGVRG